MAWRRRTVVTSLDVHPNLAEILGILSQVPQLTDRDMAGLAGVWRDTASLASARDRALRPDAPLVVEVLAAFDRVDAVFDAELSAIDDWADDSYGTAASPGGDHNGHIGDVFSATLKPHVVNNALKAVRDALAAAYARPVISRAEHAGLIGPWRHVFPAGQSARAARPDAVQDLLDAMLPLAGRCHDEHSRVLFGQLAVAAVARDAAVTAAARETAWNSAVASARRRQWAILRQTVQEALSRPCRTCRSWRRPVDDDAELVRSLCADAVCGVLMADSVEADVVSALVDPARRLLPMPRSGRTD
ncbi:MAG: hypothetical protein QOJ62_3048 [Actinomycetota bacterium]|nr:hypothetical protein [Actinomycetota bacterium]